MAISMLQIALSCKKPDMYLLEILSYFVKIGQWYIDIIDACDTLWECQFTSVSYLAIIVYLQTLHTVPCKPQYFLP